MVSLKKKIFCLFIWLLAAFQIQDGYWTYLGVTKYGIDIEGNPIIQWLLAAVGCEWGLIIPKAIGLILIAFLYKHGQHRLNCFLVALILLNIIYLWTAWNWYIFLF